MSALASWLVSSGCLDAVSSTDIIIAVRCFYLLSAVAILAVRCIPLLRDRFLDYGARGSVQAPRQQVAGSAKDVNNKLVQSLDYVATWQVSHSYFLLFYVVSTGLSILWLCNVYAREPAFKVKSWKATYAIGLMTMHSVRRLYESLCVAVPNPKSTMWIGHFAVGLAFYLLIHVAIVLDFAVAEATQNHSIISTAIPSALFLAASLWQHLYHRYLASLVKYTLPERYGARYIVTPHYTAECLLYLSLAFIATPDGHMIHRTLLCVLVFVVINLGITAEGTKAWQLIKFRERQADIERRWRMLPGLW